MRGLIGAVTAALCWLFASAAVAQPSGQPWVVVVAADDYGASETLSPTDLCICYVAEGEFDVVATLSGEPLSSRPTIAFLRGHRRIREPDRHVFVMTVARLPSGELFAAQWHQIYGDSLCLSNADLTRYRIRDPIPGSLIFNDGTVCIPIPQASS